MKHGEIVGKWLRWEGRHSSEVQVLRKTNDLFDSLMATTSFFLSPAARLRRLEQINRAVIHTILGFEDESLRRLLLGERFDGYKPGFHDEEYALDSGVITRLLGYQLYDAVFSAPQAQQDTIQVLTGGLIEVFTAAGMVDHDDASLTVIRGNLMAYAERRRPRKLRGGI